MTVSGAVDKKGCLTEGTFVKEMVPIGVATEDNDSLNVTDDAIVKDEGGMVMSFLVLS
jgi:hypothetical protein